jgi:hypothetical protein
VRVPTRTDRRWAVGLRLVLLALFATGCGRVGFDEQGTDADASVVPVSPAVVQTGIIDWQSGDSMRSAPITPVDPTKALLVFSVSVDGTSPDSIKFAGELSGADTVAFYRAGTGDVARLSWQVVSWDGWTVERGAASIPSADVEVFDVLGRSVEQTKSIVLATTYGGGTLFNDDDCVRAELISPTQVRFAISNSNVTAVEIQWQVVEMATAAVQRGLASLPMGSTSVDVPITAIDPTRSWLVQSYSSTGLDTGVVAASMQIQGRIVDSRSLRFQRGDGEGDHVIAWQVAEIPTAVVQHGALDLGVGQPVGQVTLLEVEPTSTFTFGGAWGGFAGSTFYATDANPGTSWATSRLVGRTAIELARAQTTEMATLPWSVLELR